MRRKFLSGLLVMTMGMTLFAGCGGSGSTNDGADKNAESSEKNEAVSSEMTGEEESTISTESVAETQEVEVSLQDFLESPTITGIPWQEVAFEDICTLYGLSEENGYYYENLEEYMAGTPDTEKYVSVSYDDSYNPVGIWFDTRMESGVNCVYIHFTRDEAGNLTLESMHSGFYTTNSIYGASQAELNWLEAHCSYLQDRNAFTMEDILLLWNMGNADPEMVEAAKNFSSYEGSYTTEYGETVFLLEQEAETQFYRPFSRMTVTFNDEDCPYEEVIVAVDYDAAQGNIPTYVSVYVTLRDTL